MNDNGLFFYGSKSSIIYRIKYNILKISQKAQTTASCTGQNER